MLSKNLIRLSVFPLSLLLVLSLSLTMSVPVAATAAEEPGPTFVDPTALLEQRDNIRLGHLDYIAPFAYLKAGSGEKFIHIGDESNIQDNTFLDASGGPIEIGDQVIIAHGARVLGKETPASIGEEGICPPDETTGVVPVHCPSFVGFNSEVDGAIIEKDAMVLSVARIAPGVRIPSGFKVLPGKEIESQDQVMEKTVPMVAADRAFMAAVIEVNVDFAIGYTRLRAEDPNNVFGINFDAGPTATDPDRDLPSFRGVPTRRPNYARDFGGKARIVGDVDFVQTLSQFGAVSGVKNSLRADEGEEWIIGTITTMKDNVTWHALEDTRIQLGNRGSYGVHSIIHAGPSSFGPFTHTTAAGNNFRLKDKGVLFNAVVGDNVTIGVKSLVQNSSLPSGTVVEDRTVILNDMPPYPVEW
ncbi:MAG: hypothetical protein H0W76_12635 [Pyrinomonadaceae bacterium]|nr:hypothetical protein [Pyrinomonadaceae bacterium]